MEYAIDLFTGKIASILENEVSLLLGADRELEEIKRELEYMKACINDSKSKRALSDVEETWIKNVKDKAREIVDLIDEFTYHIHKKQSQNIFYKIIHFPMTSIEKHRLASKLRYMKKTIIEISDRKQRYAVDHREHGQHGNTSSDQYETNWVIRSIGESALYQNDNDLVGIDDAKQKLMDLLLNGELERTVTSVVGMGGSGKTSLVASVLRSHAVKQRFNGFYAWITVSQTTYTIENVLRAIVKEFSERENEKIDLLKSTQTELVKMLVDKLKQKKYLVVLDDVWEIYNLWIALKQALPANLFGSRIILTTRKEDIASFSFGAKSHVYNIEMLPENEAWELFWKKAFPHDPDQCSSEVLNIAASLVRKCGGLPMALATLGAFFSTKEMQSREWRKVLQRLTWELSNNARLTVLKSVFLYSFNELPYCLKQCFLHCCIFPEDYVFEQGRLIRLWIAEGFVEQAPEGMTREEMAESYIKELVHRCMIQVFKGSYPIKMSVPRLKIHDLFREFAVSVLEAEKFCTVYNAQEVAQDRGSLYRLSIQAHYQGSYRNMSKVRSFFIFDTADTDSSSLNKLLSGFKLLRVLDLKDALLSELPKQLFNCYNLRYLNLKRTKVAQLPKEIGKLRNLTTLDIRHTKIRALPESILKLQNLRHLLMYHHILGEPYNTIETHKGTKTPAGISKLKNLQVLNSIELEEGSVLLKQLSSLTQLTTIGLINVKEAHGKELCILIERLKWIRLLILVASSEQEVLQIDEVMSAPSELEQLILLGKLQRLPSWFCSLSSLKVLFLDWSRLTEEFLPQIGALPSLISLSLTNAYQGNHLRFLTGFGKLKKLRFRNFPQLNEIVIGRGVMPELQVLGIYDCKDLSRVPLGIEHLHCLEKLIFQGVPNELTERLSTGGQDYNLIQHIPIIMLDPSF